MNPITLKPERKAQLDDYARRHGQDSETALDDVLATYLEWERDDFEQAVSGIRRGYDDIAAGRTRLAAEFFAEIRRKYGFPG